MGNWLKLRKFIERVIWKEWVGLVTKVGDKAEIEEGEEEIRIKGKDERGEEVDNRTEEINSIEGRNID